MGQKDTFALGEDIALWGYTPETCMILWTNVTPTNSITKFKMCNFVEKRVS